eukprot:TRINITY_DN870_c2_g3_i2.p1 TRINITY_DN870_c2_g3~~TRINITY_DN870_c2_g3_i2.p1  ORF type:complete len:219 (+),score=43.21 TRINITY_DN870_c2_g3_i2:80-736(+)
MLVLKGLMSPRGERNVGEMSPRGKKTEKAKLNWTRDEDNRARVLRGKKEALGEAEREELEKLETREKKFLELGMQNFEDTIVVMVGVNSGVLRAKTTFKAFAEVKLREVTETGKVIKTHENPQKFATRSVTPTPEDELSNSYHWDEKVKLAIPSAESDAIRVSIFLNKIYGKDKAFSLDIPVADIRPELRVPGDDFSRTFSATRGPGKGEVSLTFRLV